MFKKKVVQFNIYYRLPTKFKGWQIELLNIYFEKNNYLAPGMDKKIADHLELNTLQVQVRIVYYCLNGLNKKKTNIAKLLQYWFNNKRATLQNESKKIAASSKGMNVLFFIIYQLL